MPLKTPLSRSFPRLLLLAAMPVILVACAADEEPSPMPTGYKYASGQQYRVPVTGAERNMQYPGMDGSSEQSRMQPSAGEMMTPMGAPVQSVSSTTTMTTTQSTQNTTMPLMTSEAPAPMQPPVLPAPAVTAGPQWEAAADDLLNKSEQRFGKLKDPVYVRDAMAFKAGEPEFHAALVDALTRRQYKIAPTMDKAPFSFDYSLNGQSSGQETVSLITMAQGHSVSQVTGTYDTGTGAMPATASSSLMNPSMASQSTTPPMAPPMMPPPPAGMSNSSMMPAPASMPPAPASQASASQTSASMPSAPPSVSSSAPPTAPMYQAQQQMPAVPSTVPPVPGHAPMAANGDMSGSAPSATAAATDGDPNTYIYDGRTMNAPGKTAYEQIHGTDHQVGATNEESADN